MAEATPFLSSGNAGEFSPRMDARIDFEKYPAAIGRGLNLVCLPEGALTNRPGTRFIKELKSSAAAAALIPFEPVADTAYMVEAGGGYMRFYRNQGRLGVASTSTISYASFNGTPLGLLLGLMLQSTGWQNRSTGGGSASGSSSRLTLTGADDGLAWAQQNLSIAAGDLNKVHVIRFTVAGNPGGKVTAQVGSTSLAHNLFRATGMGIGWHLIAFTPTASPSYLQFINEQNDSVHVDNIEVMTNVPLEITSPYAAADVDDVRVTQSGDVQYLFHEDYPTYKLERRGDSSWSLVKAFFEDGPWLGINPDTDLGAANLLQNGRFDGGLAGWDQSVSGTGYVEYDSSSRFVLLRAQTSGAGTGAIRQQVTTGAPDKVHVLHFQTIGGGQVSLSVGTTAGGTEIVASTAYNAGWYTVSFTPGASPFHIQFVTSQSGAIAGGVGGVFCYNTRARMLQASGTTGSVTVTALDDFKPFATTDVGRSVRLEHPGREPGWGVITAVTDTQTVTVRVYRKFASTEPTETHRLGAWSATTGYPKIGTFYQQRLFTARNALRPQTIWASQTSDFENMRPDSWTEGAPAVEDDDGLDFTLAATRVSPIVWLIGARRLIVGTSTGQWAIASRGAVLTPSDFAAEPQSSVKAADHAPVQIDAVGIYNHRARRSVFDISFSFEIDGFQSSDVTQLARHITKGKVAQIVYQEEPFSQVWARLDNGSLACMAYKRAQNVVGWTPIEIAPIEEDADTAVVESIAVIPGALAGGTGQVYNSDDRDELWMIVRRTINGATKRYIEVMEGYFEGPNPNKYANNPNWKKEDFEPAMIAAQKDAFYVDCGLTYSGASTTTITGLGHLEGQTVKVVADGYVAPDAVVSGGAISLRTAATKVHVGLGYRWHYRSMKLPYGSRTGVGAGQTKTVGALVFALLDSATFEYGIDLDGNLQFAPVPFRRAGDAMTSAIPLFTGEVRHGSDGGYHTDPRVVMKGSQPMPWTLLGISPEINTSG